MRSSISTSSVSDRKRQANRQNAQKSTGPRSADGKAASSRNATQHGFYAQSPLLPSEDPTLFTEFHNSMLIDLDPESPLESTLAERTISLAWKLRRINAAETEAFTFFQEEDPTVTPGQAIARSLLDENAVFERLTRHEQRLSNMLHRALRELRELKKHRNPAAPVQSPEDKDKPTPSSNTLSPDHPLTPSISRNEPTTPATPGNRTSSASSSPPFSCFKPHKMSKLRPLTSPDRSQGFTYA